MQVFSLPNALENPSAITHLHLDRSGLETVPDVILQCENLRVLNLRGNKLPELPGWLPQLDQLEELHLSGNSIQKWSADWTAWSSLKTLQLDHNQLSTIRGARFPSGLENLNLSDNRLRTMAVKELPGTLLRLDVSNNFLKQLPDLSSCVHLRQLKADHNLIRDWPALPHSNSPLAGLQRLSLADNQLKAVPKNIGRCQTLRELDLKGNQIAILPPEVANLKWLLSLSLEGNKLSSLPRVIKQLSILDELLLADNHLKDSIDLSQNQQLRRLDLKGNPIRKIGALPSSLRYLNVRDLQLSDWSFLTHLTKLHTIELPKDAGEDLLRAICHLSGLRTLKGLLPYEKKEKLLRLLGESFSAEEKRALFDIWVLRDGKKVTQKLLEKALLSKIASLRQLARRLLLGKTEGQAIPATTKVVRLVGQFQTSDADFKELFSKRGIIKSGEAKIAILGNTPYTDFWPDRSHQWYSEAQLLGFLRKWAPEASGWSEDNLATLKKRLLHANPNQVKLALVLLLEEPLPVELLPALVLSAKLQKAPDLKRKLLTLARQHCTPTYERLLQTPLQLRNQLDKKTAIRHWAAKALLPEEELEELLSLC